MNALTEQLYTQFWALPIAWKSSYRILTKIFKFYFIPILRMGKQRLGDLSGFPKIPCE